LSSVQHNNKGAMIRAEAAAVVQQVITHNRSLDRVLEESDFNSIQQEKSIFKAICYGTIRFHWELRNKIHQFVKRPIRNKDRIIEILLETALFQIEAMRIPHHAVVSQTVEATKLLNKKNLSAFVNGMLREYLRSTKDTDCEDEEVIYNHPQWIINKTRDSWPKNFTEILKNNNLQAPMWLRVNQKKITAHQYLEKLAEQKNLKTEEVGYVGDLDYSICLKKPIAINFLLDFEKGYVSIQDGAAQIAAECLLKERTGNILDACAAPGGKTGQLLEMMDEDSRVTAIEIDSNRVGMIAQNLDRLGLHAKIITGDVNESKSWWNMEKFDLILLDVPCSASGVIRRHPDIKHLRREKDIFSLQQKQLNIINSMWNLLVPQGRLMYVTCSIFNEENDEVINQFLQKHDNVVLKDLLLNNNIKNVMHKTSYGYQLLPGSKNMDGFYFACIEKNSRT